MIHFSIQFVSEIGGSHYAKNYIQPKNGKVFCNV